jgi:2-(1,2-epoxy-1,2-dihydrophenyl)acetyl-CoA isomerase
MSDATLVERDDGLVTVTLNRPEKRNAINDEIWDDLDRVLTEVAANPDDRALLLTGAGETFSAGADLSGGAAGRPKPDERPRQSTLYEMRRVNEVTSKLQRLPKPTVAAVDGVAVGVALGWVLACDLVVASDRARFCAVFSKRGLTVDGGTSWSLPHLLGTRRAKQVAFFGDMISATDAEAWGMINLVVPADELAVVAGEWAQRLASGPTTALSLTKRMIDGASSLTFEQALEEEARSVAIAYGTHDLVEGMTAYLERRDPDFTGV